MKAAAIILNFFLPGVGSLIIGKTGEGIGQLLLYFVGLMISLTIIGAIIGLPMMLAGWIWGLVTAASWQEPPAPVQVVHVNHVVAPGHSPAAVPASPDAPPSAS